MEKTTFLYQVNVFIISQIEIVFFDLIFGMNSRLLLSSLFYFFSLIQFWLLHGVIYPRQVSDRVRAPLTHIPHILPFALS